MDTEWIDWVRWCLEGQSDDVIQSTVYSLLDLTQNSTQSHPVIIGHLTLHGHQAAGYAVMYPGAIAGLGHLRFQLDSEADTTQYEKALEAALLPQVVRQLCEAALSRGAEIVQAILPLAVKPTQDRLHPEFLAWTHPNDLAVTSVMTPVAKLVQLEHSDIQSAFRGTNRTHDTECVQSELSFVPFDSIPTSEWHGIIEATYEQTLDVPELNGCRSTSRTLEGYASMLNELSWPWWIIRSLEKNVGCLILTPLENRQVELTYLGLVPSCRGLKLANEIMRFAEDWCRQHSMNKILVAVDLRNTPAIRLYQRWGYQVRGFIQACMYFHH